MYIREAKTRNKGYKKEYSYHYLLESVRTNEGPRQTFILNLGTLDLPKKDWPLLAKRIEEILKRRSTFCVASSKIERLAHSYARKIIRKNSIEVEEDADYREIDVNRTEPSACRTVGTEHISFSYLKLLGLDKYLPCLGFTRRQTEVALMLIIGRMVSPGSERHTYYWCRNVSAVGDVLGTDFSELSLNTLYAVSDKLLAYKNEIEDFLWKSERSLFNLKETIILYDLTNTYFEGMCKANPKAEFGKSKEKRSDCRLMTLGLIIDEHGYPKGSKIFAGNQDDPGSLSEMIKELRKLQRNKFTGAEGDSQPTVVIDAGIATEDNLKLIRKEKKLHYVCVSRSKPDHVFDKDDLYCIKDEKDNKIDVKLLKSDDDGDMYLYCESLKKKKKEIGMRNKFEKHFELELENIESALQKKRGTKRYQKVCERIGRLRKKYSQVSRFYDINVIRGQKDKVGYAVKIDWKYVNKDQADEKFSGSYYLRTDRSDLDEKRFWGIHSMLTILEDAYRSMKSALGLRPNRHQKEDRADGHIFITLLAYHVMISIQNKLRSCGYKKRWNTIRRVLTTHQIVSIQQHSRDGKTIHTRRCSQPELFHKEIYDILQVPEIPVKPVRYEI